MNMPSNKRIRFANRSAVVILPANPLSTGVLYYDHRIRSTVLPKDPFPIVRLIRIRPRHFVSTVFKAGTSPISRSILSTNILPSLYQNIAHSVVLVPVTSTASFSEDNYKPSPEHHLYRSLVPEYVPRYTETPV